MVQYLKRLL
ncbi:hypothetical protein Anas_10057 [Armadillidium nasatum]|uniref:Uncharacterized protein n=1 Tax=Armadillidium nasatum TaxID=96803 RepID=A0A5N5TFB3_9CRUS|nr:hypothetical protein Anas_10057 [Armadillidium nasatum]